MIPIGFSFSLTSQADERAGLSKAATRFEAIFARQMLAAARATKFDDGGLFDSQGADTFKQMMDERFADVLAEGGSLGLGEMIEAQLSARTAPQAAAKAGD